MKIHSLKQDDFNFSEITSKFIEKNQDQNDLQDLIFLHAYEFARECCKKSKIEIWKRPKIIGSTFSRRIQQVISRCLENGTFPPPFYWLWPEFPKKSFLKINAEERRKRHGEYLEMYSHFSKGCNEVEILSISDIFELTVDLEKGDRLPNDIVCLKVPLYLTETQLKKKVGSTLIKWRSSENSKGIRLIGTILTQLKQLTILRMARDLKYQNQFIINELPKLNLSGSNSSTITRDKISAAKCIDEILKDNYFYSKNLTIIKI